MITNKGHFKKLAVTASSGERPPELGCVHTSQKLFFSDFISFYRNEHPPKKHNV